MEFANKYGYTFEHEATYDRMCLVNDAVYIARYATVEKSAICMAKSMLSQKVIFARITKNILENGQPQVLSSRFLMYSRLCSAKNLSNLMICVKLSL